MKSAKVLILLSISCTVFAGSAFALSLEEAKRQGLVGEQADGYLGLRGSSTEATALVDEVNSKRRLKYQDIAQTSGTSLKNVELLAGQKAILNTVGGQYVRDERGEWRKK